MMINQIYAIRDAAVNAFTLEFFARSEEEARRFIYQTMVKNPDCPYMISAPSYDLYYLGEVDKADGKISLPETGAPMHCCSFADVRDLVSRHSRQFEQMYQQVDIEDEEG